MARRFVPRPATRTQRRKTVWIGTANTVHVNVGSTLSLIHSSFDPSSLSMLAPTVARVRGLLRVAPQVWTADLDYSGAFGLAIVSDEAFVAGAASIPRPHDDDDWGGWILHGYYSGHIEAMAVDAGSLLQTQYVLDSKAMRKVEINETLVWMIESQAAAVTVALQARVLMMLS